MIEINSEVKQIMKQIESSGYEVYLVGGFVRDSIIGRENKDYDLCTNMPFEELEKIIPEMTIMKENEHRNTCVLRRNGEDIEISTFRGSNLKEDLLNRDFSINSIALNSDGEIIDPLNGRIDLENRQIKLSEPSGNAFRNDPLRILRAIRFSGVLGYEIEENTLNHMLDKKELLNGVAPERIYIELRKILLCDNPGELISKYREIICEIVPELKPMISFNQNNPYHIYDVFEHTMKVVDSTPKNINLRFAALFHDTGKPETITTDDEGISHFYGHPKVSANIFENFAKRMKIDKKSTINIQKLIFFHDVKLGTKSRTMNKFLQIFGDEDVDLLFDLKLADIIGQHPDKLSRLEEINKLREMYIKYLNSKPVLGVKDLAINGRTLKQMEFDGKLIGIILKDVLNMVTEEKLSNEEKEIEAYVVSKYK